MLLYILIGVILILYYIGTRNYNYWESKNVICEKPIPFFGNIGRQLMQKVNNTDLYAEYYKKYEGNKYVGLYVGSKRALLLRDPEMIKQVLLTDFSVFYSRGFKSHKDETDPIQLNLFSAEGDVWKMLRQKMTTVFTSKKVKEMFPIVVEMSEKTEKILSDIGPEGKEYNVKDLMVRYSTDFISACGFGIDADSLSQESSLFKNIGNRLFNPTPMDILIFFLKLISPGMFKKVRAFPVEILDTIRQIMRSVMRQRDFVPSERHDFIDFLLELKGKGKFTFESIEKKGVDGSKAMVEMEINEDMMAAQMFVFFGAGFETSSSAASFTLHQLAYNPEVLKKVHEEIDTVLGRHGNKLSYDNIREMKYCEMVMREALRLFPSIGYITRTNIEKYTFPDVNLTVDEGVLMVVPIKAVQLDEEHFEDPMQFRPERFHPDNIDKIKSFTYLPFGGGPRTCIGSRLAMMTTIAGLVAVLKNNTVVPSSNSIKNPPTDSASNLVQNFKGGLPLLIVPRKSKNKID